MRSLLVAAALTAVVIWIGRRWRRRHEANDHSMVSPKWLAENCYEKWGDGSRWK
jgi:hypothetical protein